MASDRRAREERVGAQLAALGIPPLYADATLDSYTPIGDRENATKQRIVLERARQFLANWPNVPMISVFLGVPGSGKGHVAWSLARAVVTERLASARVVVLSDTIRDLREAWGDREAGGLSEAQRLGKYRAADLLVIDEVSKHAFYGQPQQHLYDLVAWRELQLKPTILTTNEAGQALADFLGPALSSRALGWGAPFDFGTADYRLTRGARR
jgi:DNA replication protein DnaC